MQPALMAQEAWCLAVICDGGPGLWPGLIPAGMAADVMSTMGEWLSGAYRRAPALVIGLAALLVLPPLALLGLMRRRAPVLASSDATRVYRRGARSRAAPAEPAPDAPLWPTTAWLEIDGGQRHDIGGGIMRLGRDADNDICLPDKRVHRYHAAIHRTDDAEYVITDLSSAGGNGVLVNGLRISEVQLNDGDTIDLGGTKLIFNARPA